MKTTCEKWLHHSGGKDAQRSTLNCEPAADVGGRRARLSRSTEVGRAGGALSRGRRRAVRRGAERLGPVTGSVA